MGSYIVYTNSDTAIQLPGAKFLLPTLAASAAASAEKYRECRFAAAHLYSLGVSGKTSLADPYS